MAKNAIAATFEKDILVSLQENVEAALRAASATDAADAGLVQIVNTIRATHDTVTLKSLVKRSDPNRVALAALGVAAFKNVNGRDPSPSWATQLTNALVGAVNGWVDNLTWRGVWQYASACAKGKRDPKTGAAIDKSASTKDGVDPESQTAGEVASVMRDKSGAIRLVLPKGTKAETAKALILQTLEMAGLTLADLS